MAYIAYQTWQNPSWQSGSRYARRIYGRGDTPAEAIWDATHCERDGQVWARGAGSPSASDLSVEEVDDDDDDDEEEESTHELQV